ncbi:MAG: HAMP domain-containing protein, partial [Leptospiraceae bacterium]|nr:HAMP domain-containing protein [Leptospiraceae bacterium]
MRIPYRYKLSISIGLLSVLISGGALYIFYSIIYDTVWEQMTQRLMDVGGTAHGMMQQEEQEELQALVARIDVAVSEKQIAASSLEEIESGDLQEVLSEDEVEGIESDPGFLSLVDYLNRIREGTVRDNKRLIRYAYFLFPLKDRPGFTVFAADADFRPYDYNGNGTIDDAETAASPGSIFNSTEYPALLRSLEKGVLTADPEYTEDAWGVMISAYVPFKDSRGQVIAIMGLDMLANNELNLVNSLFRFYIAIVAISVLLTVSAAYLLGGLLTRPVSLLRMGAERVRKRDFETSIDIRTNDELEVLGETFNDMVREIRDFSSNLEKQNQAFFRFVPTQFVEILGKDNAIEIHTGESNLLNLSVLFSDIRSFTSLSEGMTPAEVLDFMNSYLEVMEPVIKDHDGFIDKYMGDGIMALFRNSDLPSANKSVNAAIAMQRELHLFNEFRKEQNAEPIRTGMGIATGDVILGTVGTETRLDTTVLGHAVNLSSRMEALTTSYGVSIIITESTFKDLVDPEQYKYREIDTVIAKGLSQPNLLYEIFD